MDVCYLVISRCCHYSRLSSIFGTLFPTRLYPYSILFMGPAFWFPASHHTALIALGSSGALGLGCMHAILLIDSDKSYIHVAKCFFPCSGLVNVLFLFNILRIAAKGTTCMSSFSFLVLLKNVF